MGEKLPKELTAEGLTGEVFQALVRVAIGAAKKVLTRPDQEADLEEAVMDVMRTLLERLDAGESVYNSGGFVSRVARYRAIDYLRAYTAKAEMEQALEGIASLDELLAGRTTETAEARQWLRELFDSLPRRQGQCLDLYYLEEKSEKEIAMILGIQIGTVKKHVHRGHTTILSILRRTK